MEQMESRNAWRQHEILLNYISVDLHQGSPLAQCHYPQTIYRIRTYEIMLSDDLAIFIFICIKSHTVKETETQIDKNLKREKIILATPLFCHFVAWLQHMKLKPNYKTITANGGGVILFISVSGQITQKRLHGLSFNLKRGLGL